MKISDVKTATKLGDFVLKNNHRHKISNNYNKDVLNDSVARIYLCQEA